MRLQIIDQEANKILEQFKNNKITKDKTRKLLFVLSGINKSSYCKLDRIKEECSIAQNTIPHGECDICGHLVN